VKQIKNLVVCLDVRNLLIICYCDPQLDIKYLSPLLLAYEDRMKEKDELIATLEVGQHVSQRQIVKNKTVSDFAEAC
jgi:hypothetical protein